MEKKELEETNGASPPNVGKPKEDGFVVRDEDLEKQSNGVKSLNDDTELDNEEDDTSENKITSHVVEKVEVDASNIQNEQDDESDSTSSHGRLEFDNEQDDESDSTSSHGVLEFDNEQDDVSDSSSSHDESDSMSSHAVENVEGDASNIQNEDHNISREVEIENIDHGGLEFDNEQDDVSDNSSSHAVESLEGDASSIQNEDHNISREVEIENIGHGGLEFDNEQDDVSDSSSSHAVESLEGDASNIQNEDHNISREVEIENIGHGGLEFDNEQDDVSDSSSDHAVESLEGDASNIQNEDHNISREVEIENIGHGGVEFDNEQDDVSDSSSSHAVESLEGDASNIQNEDHNISREVEIQNIGHGGLEFDNEQDDVSDNSSAHAVENLEGDASNIQNEDHNISREVEIENIGHGGLEFDNEQDDVSDNSSAHAVESLEGDASNIQNEDHNISREVEIQSIGHGGLEFDNEQDDVSDSSSSHAVESLEGDASNIQNEDHNISREVEIQNIGHGDLEFDNEQDDVSDSSSDHAVENLEGDASNIQNEDHNISTEVEIQNIGHGGLEFDNEQDDVSDKESSHAVEKLEGDTFTIQNEDHDKELKDMEIQHVGHDCSEFDKEPDDISDKIHEFKDVYYSTREEVVDNMIGGSELAQGVDESRDLHSGPQEENLEASSSNVSGESFHEVILSNSLNSEIQVNYGGKEYCGANMDNNGDFESKFQEVHLNNNFTSNDLGEENDDSRSMDSTQKNHNTENTSFEDRNSELVLHGKEVLVVEASQGTSTDAFYADPGTPRVVERAVALTNFVRVKSVAAVSTVLRRLSGKKDEDSVCNYDDVGKDVSALSRESEPKDVTSNPLSYTKMSSNVNVENKTNQREEIIVEGPPKPIAMKGRIILYTRLGCQESKKVRQFLYMKRLRYVEINIDVYPGRKTELENISGSTSVPKVFFNEILIGGLTELKTLNESGKLDEKIDFLITEPPSFEGPFPPLSGEDDLSSSGALDEMALIVRKMKESIVVKDRFSKMRRFTNCFLGSEAVDFLSEDQYLERKEAVEFGRKLASKLFFQHVLDENLFEDGNHLYRFLDDDPIVASQCHNIPRGIITVKPKPITEIASRLRFLSYALFEAYASEDGRHVDYRSMHGSEEFARYLRVAEELQRVEILNMSREEKLAFFINLYNMMTIHAILIWGHPTGALERRRLFWDFKYVISGCTYSLSAIQNGILRGNQRPPYSLMKPFGAKDKRAKVALPFCEPLIHFALVCGTRSGPALRCYSPGEIDKELMDAARNFIRSGGLLIDFTTKVANASKILKWFSVDFGKNEVDVMKHVSIYLDPADLELLLDLLATFELKVTYQPYDWGLNC